MSGAGAAAALFGWASFITLGRFFEVQEGEDLGKDLGGHCQGGVKTLLT